MRLAKRLQSLATSRRSCAPLEWLSGTAFCRCRISLYVRTRPGTTRVGSSAAPLAVFQCRCWWCDRPAEFCAQVASVSIAWALWRTRRCPSRDRVLRAIRSGWRFFCQVHKRSEGLSRLRRQSPVDFGFLGITICYASAFVTTFSWVASEWTGSWRQLGEIAFLDG